MQPQLHQLNRSAVIPVTIGRAWTDSCVINGKALHILGQQESLSCNKMVAEKPPQNQSLLRGSILTLKSTPVQSIQSLP